MNPEQLIIGITGLVWLWTALKPRNQRQARWALLIILAGQPFWLLASYEAGQWGIFLSSLIWTAAWAKATWEEWRG